MGLGQLRGPSWKTGAPPDSPNSMAIVALVGLDVCDGGHWPVVMKKVRCQIAEADPAAALYVSTSETIGAWRDPCELYGTLG